MLDYNRHNSVLILNTILHCKQISKLSLFKNKTVIVLDQRNTTRN